MRPSNCTVLISVPVASVWQVLQRFHATSCAGVFTNEAHPFTSSNRAVVAMTSAVLARRWWRRLPIVILKSLACAASAVIRDTSYFLVGFGSLVVSALKCRTTTCRLYCCTGGRQHADAGPRLCRSRLSGARPGGKR